MKATLAELDQSRQVATPARSHAQAPSDTASATPSAVTPAIAATPVTSGGGGDDGKQVAIKKNPSIADTEMDGEDVPYADDLLAEKPQLNQHTLSPNAIRQRAQRIFKRRTDGSLKVTQTIFDEWHSKGKDRKMLETIFKQCGYDVEP